MEKDRPPILTNLISDKSRTMTWTSPHLIRYEERFKLNGENILSSSLSKSLDSFLSLYPDNSAKLSFYEISFWLLSSSDAQSSRGHYFRSGAR